MKLQHFNNLVSILNNISLVKIASIYGYDLSLVDQSKIDYFEGKLKQAIDNPLYWLSSLDNTNRVNLINKAMKMQS